MAKKGGGFGRVLNFIGLVDDEDPQDIYEDEYTSGDYGRQQPYAPQRQQPRQPQRQQSALTTRRAAPASTYAPTRPPRMNRGGASSASRFDQPQRSAAAPRRATAQPERPARYDYTPRTSRFGSLEDSPADAQRSASRNSNSGRQRTVMFTLRHLEDCCDVIDNLISNNTVVLTIDDIDPRLMQRAVDTLSGAVFALHATIRKASEHTYLIAPSGVEVNETYDMGRY